jgi:hypothetical protein
LEIAGNAVVDVCVVTVAIRGIADVLSALIGIVAIDASAEHRVLTNADHAHPWEPTKITGSAVCDIHVVALSGKGIAHVLTALIGIVAVDASAKHRVFAQSTHAKARQVSKIARGAVHDVRVGALTV